MIFLSLLKWIWRGALWVLSLVLGLFGCEGTKDMSNGLKVIPRAATLIPGNTQTFTMAGNGTPALWLTPTNGTFQADYTVRLTNGLGGGNVDGAYQIPAGTGRATWVLDSRMRPTSTGSIEFEMKTGNATVSLRVSVSASTFLVQDFGGSTLFTMSHSAANGDVIAIEVGGSTISAFLNGTLRYAYAPSGGVQYPCRYDIVLTEPLVSNPSFFLPPALSGNWQMKDSVTWTATPNNGWFGSGGLYPVVLSPPITGNSATWVVPNRPGTYEIKGVLAASAYQNATATVVVPTLKINGPRSVTLDPGAIVQFTSNYDANEQRILTWSAGGGGGSFSSTAIGQYTAPVTPGTYTVRCTALFDSVTQYDEIQVIVPNVLTPENVRFVAPSSQTTFTTNLSGTKTWSVTAGTLDTTSGSTVVFTAPSTVGAKVRIQVVNGSVQLFQDIEVLAVLPVAINVGVPHEIGPETLIAYPDGGRDPWIRTKTEAEFVPASFDCTTTLSVTDYEALEAFHDARMRDGARFFFTEHYRNSRRTAVRFDSKLQAETLGCLIQVQFKLKKA